jgi:uncharacterized protein
MEISSNIRIFDLGLLINNSDEYVLVFSDFHLGYEESLNKKGVLVPRFQFQDTIERLDKIFEVIDSEGVALKNIIVNGDIKHEFGRITEQEWREVLKLIDYLKSKCSDLILIKGNHDNVSQYVAERRDIELVDYCEVGSVLVLHGDVLPEKLGVDLDGVETLVIGHEHPAIGLRESAASVRTEKFKCFLKGKFSVGKLDVDLIVMPSFNLVTEGTDVSKGRLLSPFLKASKNKLGEFELFLVADEVRYFGRIKDLS